MQDDPRFTLLDGAMGAELRSRGVNIRDYKSSLWSALACVETPDAVVQLHRDYIESGADVITVNNYAMTPPLLAREGLEEQLEPMTAQAIDCALRGRDAASREARIAGSLAPLDTTFDASLVGSYDDNLARYRRIVAALGEHVDLYLCETLSMAQEARAAAVAAQETGRPFMVSWTIDRDGNALRGGDSFADAIAAVSELNPEAMLFNCTSCNAISAALPRLRQLTDLPIGGYANPTFDEPAGGEPEYEVSEPISPEQYAVVAQGWAEHGATVVGGCCGTNPDYIAALRRTL